MHATSPSTRLSAALAAVCAATALLVAAPPAEARPGGWHGGYGGHAHGPVHGGRHWGGVPFWGGLGIGIGLGTYYAAPWYPGYVVVEPPVVYRDAPAAPPPEPVARSAPDPVIYPRSGQSAAQTEADRRDCNRWATTQPSAMNDASVFQRATVACMEGRGYTVR